MKRITMFVFLMLTCVVCMVVIAPEDVTAVESFTVQVSFYQGIALNSGMTAFDPTVLTVVIGDVLDIETVSSPLLDQLFQFSAPVDLFFGFSTDMDNPFSVFAENLQGMAVLEDFSFESFSDDLLATLMLTESTVSFDGNDLIALLTNDNTYFIVGNVAQHDVSLQFEYQKVGSIPEPATAVLLGMGLLGVIYIMREKKKNTLLQGRHRLLQILLIILGLSCVLNSASADVELRVENTGTGTGIVRGEGIYCEPDCQETYPEKTAVHLKATPLDDSKFVGWFVDEEQIEGIMRIEQDTLVTALFELNGASSLPVISEVIDANGFKHPGIGLTKANLETLRVKVQAQAEPWKTYFDVFSTSGTASASVTSSNENASDKTKPKTTAFTSKGAFVADGLKAYSQALMYVITGDEIYRANALHIIRIWSQMDPTRYTYFADAHIHTGIPLYRMTLAAEILRYTSFQSASYVSAAGTTENMAWTDQDTADYTNNLITPVIEELRNHEKDHFMNQHLYPLLGCMAGYIFTSNLSRYEEAVEWFTVNSTANDQGFNGAIKQLFRLIDEAQTPGIKVGEGIPVAPHVQHLEMGRDQAHGGGDLLNLIMLSRMLLAQGTQVDPVTGTISTAANAVGPYEFLNDRILAAGDFFWQYMLGYDTPWTPVAYAISPDGTIRDTYNYISPAYRGRYSTAVCWDLFSYYKYIKHENVAQKAPHIYEAFTKKPAMTTDNWEGPDGGYEFWLYLPTEAEADAALWIPKDHSTDIVFEVDERYTKLDDTTTTMQEGKTSFVRFHATEAGSEIVYLNSHEHNTLTYGLKIRTNGTATLQAQWQIVVLPNTHGEWQYVVVDITLGDFATFTVTGAPGTTVDFDHILKASSGLTPPVFNAGSSDVTIYTYVGASVNIDFSATDAGSADVVTYGLQNHPQGVSMNAETGQFSWNPAASGNESFLVTATDGTTVAAKNVTIIVASNRAEAVQALASSLYDPDEVYVAATLENYQTVYNQTLSVIDTATDQEFDAQLQALRSTAESLEVVTPLAPDGETMRWSSVAYWTSFGTYVSNMDDCDYTTGVIHNIALGALPHLYHEIDFGPDYKITAYKFGFQSNIFADRLANSTVYGSNDGETWTRLIPGVTPFTQTYNTLDIDPAYQNTRYRYIKLEMIEPLPDVLYGIVRNYLQPTEFRIYGTRHEIGNKIETISMTSDHNFMGRIVLGDPIDVSVTAREVVQNLEVRVQGESASVTTEDNIHWFATVTLTDSDQIGPVKVAVDYQKQDGTAGDTVYSTTDGSTLFVVDESDLIDNLTEITTLIDSTTASGRSAAETLKQVNYLFDSDGATNSDFRLNGSGSNSYIAFDFREGNGVLLSNVEILARQDRYFSRLAGAVVQGSHDGEVWTDLTAPAGGSLDWQILKTDSTESYRYIRIFNANSWYGNMAELRLHGVIEKLSKLESVSIDSDQGLKGRIVAGDTARLSFTSTEAISNVNVTIQGQTAAVSSTDNINWTAEAVLSQGTASGEVEFRIAYDNEDGSVGYPITATTDGSKLILVDESDVIANVVEITDLIDSTTSSGRSEAETLKQVNYLFDSNINTNSDFRLNGSGSGSYIIFDFKAGNQVYLSSVDLLARQDKYYTRIAGAVVQGSNDNEFWTDLTQQAASTADWQIFDISSTEAYRYIRIFNSNKWYGNMGELRLHGTVER